MKKIIIISLIVIANLIALPTIASAETLSQFIADGQLSTADGKYTIFLQSFNSGANPTTDGITFTDSIDGSIATVNFIGNQNDYTTTLNYQFVVNNANIITSLQIANSSRDDLSTYAYNGSQLVGSLTNKASDPASPAPLALSLSALVIDNTAIAQNRQHDTPFSNTFNLAVTVPLPAAAGLFVSGIFGFLGMQLKRKARLD